MNKELEALINKALYEDKEVDKKEEEKKKIPVVTEEEREKLYEKDKDKYWNN